MDVVIVVVEMSLKISASIHLRDFRILTTCLFSLEVRISYNIIQLQVFNIRVVYLSIHAENQSPVDPEEIIEALAVWQCLQCSDGH